jgi:transcriptional regulator with XRE-family HTH domain
MKFNKDSLRRLRSKCKMSYDTLSQELAIKGFRITGRALENWEKGPTEPSFSAVASMSAVFGKPLDFFLSK